MNLRTAPTLNDNIAGQNLAADDPQLQTQLVEMTDMDAFAARIREEEGRPESFAKALSGAVLAMIVLPVVIVATLRVIVIAVVG